MITYHPQKNGYILVRLDGKKTGEIRPRQNGYRYYPKGSASPGEWFPSLPAIKASLEFPEHSVPAVEHPAVARSTPALEHSVYRNWLDNTAPYCQTGGEPVDGINDAAFQAAVRRLSNDGKHPYDCKCILCL